MKNPSRGYYTAQEQIYSAYDYRSRRKVQKSLKDLLKLYVMSQKGSIVSPSCQDIWVDITNALGQTDTIMGALTQKQREAIYYNLILGYTGKETAELLGITQQAVSCRVISGINRMRTFLTGGKIKIRDWSKAEEDFLKQYFADKGAKWCASELDRSVSQVQGKWYAMQKNGGN